MHRRNFCDTQKTKERTKESPREEEKSERTCLVQGVVVIFPQQLVKRVFEHLVVVAGGGGGRVVVFRGPRLGPSRFPVGRRMHQNDAELNVGEDVRKDLVLADEVGHEARIRARGRLASQLRKHLLAEQHVLRDLQFLLPMLLVSRWAGGQRGTWRPLLLLLFREMGRESTLGHHEIDAVRDGAHEDLEIGGAFQIGRDGDFERGLAMGDRIDRRRLDQEREKGRTEFRNVPSHKDRYVKWQSYTIWAILKSTVKTRDISHKTHETVKTRDRPTA